MSTCCFCTVLLYYCNRLYCTWIYDHDHFDVYHNIILPILPILTVLTVLSRLKKHSEGTKLVKNVSALWVKYSPQIIGSLLRLLCTKFQRRVFKCSHPEIGAGAPFFHQPKMLVSLNKLREMQLKVRPLKGKV